MTKMTLPIVLGSSSKGRRAVLEKLGVPIAAIMSPDIDEKAIRRPDAASLTLAIANAKADALQHKMHCLLITSDQVVVCNGAIREKPRDEAEARAFLQSYGTAECVNAVVVTNTKTGERVSGVERCTVHFKPIPDDVVTVLIAQGDVMHCAGGVCIEQLERYLLGHEGEEECIMGMPRSLTLKLLSEAL